MPSETVDGISINYRDTGGDGPAIVFVHAFPLNSAQWDDQVMALAGSGRAIAVDLMGFGASDAPDEIELYSIAAFADQTRAVIDAAGVRRATLVGLSMGGYVCFELWRRHREAIGAMVLADTRAEPDTPEASAKRTAQQDQVRRNGTEVVARALLGGLLSDATRSSRPEVVERARRLMDGPAAGYVGALEALKARPESTGDLPGIDVPVVVIVGEEDAVTPPAAARAMHESIAGSRLVVLPGAGHLSNLEAPERFTAALLALQHQMRG